MVQVPGVDDAAEFQATVSAMSIMGMSVEDLSGKIGSNREKFI